MSDAVMVPGLRDAAQAVVDRWETPLWKDVEPTAHVIARLRQALAASTPVGGWEEDARDISGETVMGMRVAAYRHPIDCPAGTDPVAWTDFFRGDPPNTYSEHWSTPGAHRTDVERLFTEADVRARFAPPPPSVSIDNGPRPQEAVPGEQAEPAVVALHPATADLVNRFSAALREKLAKAEAKYGYSDGWLSGDWREDLVRDPARHVQKGDPRDVAAYCAFAWHHGWSTTPVAPDGLLERLGEALQLLAPDQGERASPAFVAVLAAQCLVTTPQPADGCSSNEGAGRRAFEWMRDTNNGLPGATPDTREWADLSVADRKAFEEDATRRPSLYRSPSTILPQTEKGS